MDWIELWLQQEARHPAILLALLEPEDEEARSPVRSYLQEVARRGGMELLVEAWPS